MHHVIESGITSEEVVIDLQRKESYSVVSLREHVERCVDVKRLHSMIVLDVSLYRLSPVVKRVSDPIKLLLNI